MKAAIPQSYLKSALLFAAKEDVRYYLNGVLVESSPTETRVTATNGHALSCLQYTPGKGENEGFCASVIIPRETLEVACKWRNAEVLTIAGPMGADAEYRISSQGNIVVFKPINGTFPDYKRVIRNAINPDVKDAGKPTTVQPEYLMAAQKLVECLGGKKTTRIVSLQQNGDSAAIVNTGYSNVCVLIMPIRADSATEYTAPDWATVPVETPVATCSDDVAAVIDPNGVLRAKGMLTVTSEAP